MKIIFLRHGLTESNKDFRFSTPETRISKNAYIDLDKSKKNLEKYNIDKVFTSKLIRSQETAKYLGFDKFIQDERINEMDFGDFKGQKVLETREKYKDFYNKLKKNPYKTKYPNGESVEDLIKRINDFMEEKSSFDGNILCISHGIAIRASLFTILKDMENFENFWIDNGSLTIFDISENKKMIECVNLIWNLFTFLIYTYRIN